MKEILQGAPANARKLATFTFIGFAVAFSFLAGCCIRWLVVLGAALILRYCLGYLVLLSC
jgi:hypothetical protein